MLQLHETIMGRRLIEGTLPDIASQLKRIADGIEKKKDMEEELTSKLLLDFLQYEEALTQDKETANRISKLLKDLGVWK